jgi:F420-non-reducing hydrogenase iron-sulfur subunit
MCSSRVDPIFLIASYLRGADGVFIGGCHPGDCHYQQGNYYTRRRFALLKSLFEALGMEVGRIKLSWISASEGAKFARTVTDYTEYVKKLGPNPVRKEIFL